MKSFNPTPEQRTHRREYNRKRWHLLKEKLSVYNRSYQKRNGKARANTLKGRFHTYNRSAKLRDIPFELTFEEFKEFWQKPCSYCDSPIETIGLDRVDNSKGYISSNIVPCCSDCNYARGDIFSYQEMVKELGPAIKRIKRSRDGT